MRALFIVLIICLKLFDPLSARPRILTKCYRPFGCFHIGGPYTSIWRPFNIIPLPPEFLEVSFGLRTRKNVVKFSNLDPFDKASFHASHFDPKLPIFFIIHGYLEQNKKYWIMEMSSELLKHRMCNVIAVDWRMGAIPPYSLAIANSRLVGAVVAHFIKFLQNEYHIDPSHIHIIGHSLGAHIGGYVGDRIPHLGRITGLDPALPLFYKVHKKLRLDHGDALFVDVIHTDSKRSLIHGPGLGLDDPCGHVDFYPNGGKNQPGCQPHKLIMKMNLQKNVFQEIRHLIGCNHIRAYEYFTESINTRCPFTSFLCSGWDDFSTGKCSTCGPDGSGCTRLGFHSVRWRKHLTKPHNKFYLSTAHGKPYCLLQRKITLKTSRNGQRRSDEPTFGKLTVDTRGPRGMTIHKKIIRSNSASEIAFMTGSRDPDPIYNITVKWKHKISVWNPKTWFDSSELHADEIIVNSVDMNREDWFCAPRTPFKSGMTMSYKHC